jgi:hypothetical protein
MHTDPRPSRPTRARPPGVPSRRVAGALVAGALTLGLLAGALIAPAPPSSLASGSNVLTRLLALLASQGGGSRSNAAPAAQAMASTNAPAASATAAKPASATAPAGPSSTAPGEGSPSESPAPSGAEEGTGEKKPVRLPPVSHVWLVVLSGSGFAQASAAPAGYPYLTGQLLKDGTLLERYSAIEAYELSGDVALLTGGIGQSLSTISQPCGPAASTGQPSGTTGPEAGSVTAGACANTNPVGGQTEADAFLQHAVAAILSSSAYREDGLVAITFGSAAQEMGPPALSLMTLAATPPAGALLLSPRLKARGHSSEAFNSLAPRKSLEAIFAAS